MPRYRYSPNDQLSQPACARAFDHDCETTPTPIDCDTPNTGDRHCQACSWQIARQVFGRHCSMTLSFGQERRIRPPERDWSRRNSGSLGWRRTGRKVRNNCRGSTDPDQCSGCGGEGVHLSLRRAIVRYALLELTRDTAECSADGEHRPGTVWRLWRPSPTHRNSTTPVSSEYSAPTTRSPSFWISCSRTCEPCRR